jgi:hypothetical protein
VTRLQREQKKIDSKSSEETATVSKTPQISLDSRGGNAIKKTKRINVESGYKRRSFKLSLFFMLLQLVSILLGYVIVVADVMFLNTDNKLAADLSTLHDMNILVQIDSFVFHVD